MPASQAVASEWAAEGRTTATKVRRRPMQNLAEPPLDDPTRIRPAGRRKAPPLPDLRPRSVRDIAGTVAPAGTRGDHALDLRRARMRTITFPKCLSGDIRRIISRLWAGQEGWIT